MLCVSQQQPKQYQPSNSHESCRHGNRIKVTGLSLHRHSCEEKGREKREVCGGVGGLGVGAFVCVCVCVCVVICVVKQGLPADGRELHYASLGRQNWLERGRMQDNDPQVIYPTVAAQMNTTAEQSLC